MIVPLMPLKKRFISPPELQGTPSPATPEFYTAYNYLNNQYPIAMLKRRHFNIALAWSKRFHHHGAVIDFGCADGPFLPSLSYYFKSVMVMDHQPRFISQCDELIAKASLPNVRTLCNAGDSLALLADERADVIFLLEVLEHYGHPQRQYESKIELLDRLAPCLNPGGMFIISVPVMVGLPFLLQRLGLSLFRLRREPITVAQMFRAGLLCDTRELESMWNHEHLGFNHKHLRDHLDEHYRVIRAQHDFFQVLYAVQPRAR